MSNEPDWLNAIRIRHRVKARHCGVEDRGMLLAHLDNNNKENSAYIRGYVEAIVTLFDKKGGQKVVAFATTWDAMRAAGVKEHDIERVRIWLEAP